MGEAKRRKKLDPSYGKPKRGLVVSPPIEIEGNSLFARSSNLDLQELRMALLYWDRLVWPSSRAIHFASGPDEQFLESAGILRRPDYTVWGDAAKGIAEGQIRAFLDLDTKEPGMWSLAQGENSLVLKDRDLVHHGGAFIELLKAVPAPDLSVPLNEILEFKQKRYDALFALREELDGLVASVNKASDQAAELEKQVKRVEISCVDMLKATKEWPFPVRLTNLKASVDMRPHTTLVAGASGFIAGNQIEMPLATALLASAAASIKFGGDFVLKNLSARLGPYRYAYQFHKELL